MSSERKSWVIVGGGVLGLSLALRMSRRGCRVTLLEAAPNAGGLADAWQLGDVTWDRHYHVILLSDLFTRRLLEDIGLADELCWRETKTGFLVDGRLVSFSNVWDFLRFPPLSLWDKFRLGWTIFYASKLRDGVPLEQIPVADWLIKLSGRRTFHKIWLPLLKAKLGDNYDRASAAFIWSTIQRMYAARRTGLKKEMFGYVRGGYARILGRLTAALEEQGVELRTSWPVSSIAALENESGFQITGPDGEVVEADRVIVTTPAPVAAKLCDDLAPDEKERLTNVAYQGIVCASVLLKKPLAHYYVTNITDDVPFTAVIEMTALVDRAELNGHSLVYLPKYLPQDSPLWQETDDSFRERFLSALARNYPAFTRDDVLAFRVSRVRHVMPIPTLNYSAHLPPQVTSLPGLYLVNSAHIVNGTLNVNETIRLAEQALDFLPLQTPDPASRRAAHATATG